MKFIPGKLYRTKLEETYFYFNNYEPGFRYNRGTIVMFLGIEKEKKRRNEIVFHVYFLVNNKKLYFDSYDVNDLLEEEYNSPCFEELT